MLRLMMVVVLILGAYVYLYPRYKVYQTEKLVRLEFKLLPYEGMSNHLSTFGGDAFTPPTYHAHTEFLNQYPHLFFW